MAKVGPSTDALTQLKNQYQSREKELETRHRDEISELREANRVEVERIREESQKRVQDVVEDNNVKLNQKDIHHQKEIEALKAIYSKRISDGKKPG